MAQVIMEEIKKVEKEEIANMHFPHNEVLTDKLAIGERTNQLKKAQALGNTEKHKITIVFEDTEGKKEVKTTVWAAGSDNIVLKQGVFIPVHAIHSIKLL